MAVPRDSRLPDNEVLDALFMRVQRARAAAPAPPPPGAALPPSEPPARDEGPATVPASADTVPVPGQGSQVEQDWLREEKQSLVEFTRRQFESLRQQQELLERQRQEVLRRQSDLNETCLLRQQELNRQIKVLATQAAALEEREKDVAEGEKRLAVEEQRVGRARQDLQQYSRETATKERDLEELKAETERLLHAEREARRQRAAEEASLRQRWQGLRAKHDQIEQRAAALGRGEAELTAGRAEVEQLKAVLEQDVAARNLERLRQETLAQQEALTKATGEAERAREEGERARRQLGVVQEALEACRRAWREEEAEWEARRRPMEQRYRALEQAEAALVRRTAELDRLEEQVRDELLSSASGAA